MRQRERHTDKKVTEISEGESQRGKGRGGREEDQ